MERRKIMVLILTPALIFSLSGIFHIEGHAGSVPGTRIVRTGHISANETWTEDVQLTNVVIDPRVTVVVEEGVNISCVDSSFFYVEGSLIFNGTKDHPVRVFGDVPGSAWCGLIVNVTGSIDLDRFIMERASSDFYLSCIKLLGRPSRISNGTIKGRNYGIEKAISSTSSGGHIIGPMTIKDYGTAIRFFSNKEATLVHNITILNCESGIVVNKGNNLTFQDIRTSDMVTAFSITDASNVRIDRTHVGYEPFDIGNQTHPDKGKGLYLWGSLDNVSCTDIWLKNMSTAIMVFSPDNIKDVTFNSLHLSEDSEVVMKAETAKYLKNEFEISIIDSQLGTSGPLCNFTDPDPQDEYTNHFDIELINTTYNNENEMVLEGSGFINISWYLSLAVLDGIGRPLDSNFLLKDFMTGDIALSWNLPDGVLSDLPLLSRVLTGTHDDIIYYTLVIESKDDPYSMFRKDIFSLDRSVKMEVVIDLHPYCDRPYFDIEMDEDSVYEMEITDHFFDPEGGPLAFEISADENLTAVIEGTLLSISSSNGNWTGEGALEITCFDDAGNHTTAAMSVHVAQVNDPPYLIADLPDLETFEDVPTYINLTGMAADIEGDALSWSFVESGNCSLEWVGQEWNLSIGPATDFTGTLDIPLNLTDGSAWVEYHLFADVLPVNDPPLPSVDITGGPALDPRYNNGTLFFEATLLEDEPIHLSIGADDIDSDTLWCKIVWSEMTYGDVLPIEGYQPNWTYSLPLELGYQGPRDFSGLDILPLNITDGIESVLFYIIFNISSVNDPPKFHVAIDWDFQVTAGADATMDLSQSISDPDHDELTISVSPDDHIEVVGMTLHIAFPANISEDEVIVNVTASDGPLSSSRDLRIMIDKELPFIGPVEIEAVDDGWTVMVEGEEGYDLYLIVIGGGGLRLSFPMTYSDGHYQAFVPADRFDAGDSFFIAMDEDGDLPFPESDGELPKSGENGGRLLCLYMVLASLFLLLVGALLLIFISKKMRERREGMEE